MSAELSVVERPNSQRYLAPDANIRAELFPHRAPFYYAVHMSHVGKGNVISLPIKWEREFQGFSHIALASHPDGYLICSPCPPTSLLVRDFFEKTYHTPLPDLRIINFVSTPRGFNICLTSKELDQLGASTKSLLVVGAISRFEIWEPDNYHNRKREREQRGTIQELIYSLSSPNKA